KLADIGGRQVRLHVPVVGCVGSSAKFLEIGLTGRSAPAHSAMIASWEHPVLIGWREPPNRKLSTDLLYYVALYFFVVRFPGRGRYGSISPSYASIAAASHSRARNALGRTS